MLRAKARQDKEIVNSKFQKSFYILRDYSYCVILMSKIKGLKEFLKTFWSMTKEDWSETDHKLLRIASGVVGFAIAAFFWFYFFRNIAPFHF